jgi:hypothetical protein
MAQYTGSGCLFDCHPESRIQGSKKHYDEDQGSGMETVRIRNGKKSDPGPGDFRKHIFSNLKFYIDILPKSRDIGKTPVPSHISYPKQQAENEIQKQQLTIKDF